MLVQSRVRARCAPRWLRASASSAIVAGVALLVMASAAQPQEKKGALLQVALEGWLHNQQSFKNVQCRFRVRDGWVDTREAALTGDFEPYSVVDATWVLRDNCEKWTHGSPDFDPQETMRRAKEAASKGQTRAHTAGFAPREFMSNGRQQLRYNKAMQLVNLFAEDNQEAEFTFLLFGLEGLGPGRGNRCTPRRTIAAIEEGTVGFEGADKFQGQEVMVVSRDAREQNAKFHYWLAPQQGFMPIRQFEHWPERKVENMIVELTRCSGGRYFPKRHLRLEESTGGKTKKRFLVREYMVSELNVDDVPRDEAFVVDLPSATTVVDRREAKTTFVLDAPLSVGLNDLDKMLERGNQAKVQREFEGELPPAKAVGSIRWSLVALVLSAVAVAAVVIMAVYRARRKHTAA